MNLRTALELLYPIPFNLRWKLLNMIIIQPNSKILTIKELATCLKITEETIYRFVSNGKILMFKIGSNWLFSKAKIKNWIKFENKGDDK